MISHCIEKELGMAYVDWMIKGPKISSCSCNYGCPCEFNALPTHDVCEGLEALRIDGGFFGDLRLDGIVIARVSTGQVRCMRVEASARE